MLKNARVTAFTVSVLLRKNQGGKGGSKITPFPQPRLRLNRCGIKCQFHHCLQKLSGPGQIHTKNFQFLGATGAFKSSLKLFPFLEAISKKCLVKLVVCNRFFFRNILVAIYYPRFY